jgi:MHS family proline/betaine transporter-like MFS transporter
MQATRQNHLLRNTVGGVCGNILEWYDFAVFGFLAPVMSGLFFPEDDLVAGLIKTYGIFAAGYLMRPLGGIIFGHIGDKFGRKKALQLSIMLMAVPTVLVGCLPTHAQIGVYAALLLILLRLLQGVSVGGELIGSVSFLVESAPAGRKGLQGSWTLCSAIGGILLGSLVVTVLTSALGPETMQTWGWRLPFLSGVVILVLGSWLRSGLAESPEFLKELEKKKPSESPLKATLTQMPGRILHLCLALLCFSTSFYMLFVWMPTYLTDIVSPPVEHALLINTLSLVVLIVAIPLAGALSDRTGRKKMLLAANLVLGISVYPLFLLLDSAGVVTALVIQLFFAVMIGAVQGPVPALLVEMFPTRYRYTGIALCYNLGLAVFGGTSPLVSTWLIRSTGNPASPALYLAVLAGLSLIGLGLLQTGRNNQLIPAYSKG